jgi:hypothetical protein
VTYNYVTIRTDSRRVVSLPEESIQHVVHRGASYRRDVNIIDCLRVERCAIDEFQSQEGKDSILRTVFKISALYRWFISGTPFTKERDLLGILHSLRHPLAQPLFAALDPDDFVSPMARHDLLAAALVHASQRQPHEEKIRTDLQRLSRSLILKTIVVPLLKPIILRRFPRAFLSAEKVRALDFNCKLGVALPTDDRSRDRLAADVRRCIMAPDELARFESPSLLPTLSAEQVKVYQEQAAELAPGKPCIGPMRRLIRASCEAPDDAIVRLTHKVSVVLDLVETVLRQSERNRIIIYYDYNDMESKLWRLLQSRGLGAIKHTDSKPDVLKAFCDGSSEKRVIIMNIRKLVDGFNASSVNHVIFMAPFLELWRVDQAMSRPFGIGQGGKEVRVWFLAGSTPFETWALDRLLRGLHADTQLGGEDSLNGDWARDLQAEFQRVQSGVPQLQDDAVAAALERCQADEYEREGYCAIGGCSVPLRGPDGVKGKFYGLRNGRKCIRGAFVYEQGGKKNMLYFNAQTEHDYGYGPGLWPRGVTSASSRAMARIKRAEFADRVGRWLEKHRNRCGGSASSSASEAENHMDEGEDDAVQGDREDRVKMEGRSGTVSEDEDEDEGPDMDQKMAAGEGSGGGSGEHEAATSQASKRRRTDPSVGNKREEVFLQMGPGGIDSRPVGHGGIAVPFIGAGGGGGGSASGAATSRDIDRSHIISIDLDLPEHEETIQIDSKLEDSVHRAIQSRYDNRTQRPDYYAVSLTENIGEEFDRWVGAGEGWDTFLVVGEVQGSMAGPFHVATRGRDALRRIFTGEIDRFKETSTSCASRVRRSQERATIYVFVAVQWAR